MEYNVSHLPDKNEIHIEHSPLILKLRKEPQLTISTIEERYEVENKMLEAVSKGDDRHAHEFYQKFQTYQLRPRTDNADVYKRQDLYGSRLQTA